MKCSTSFLAVVAIVVIVGVCALVILLIAEDCPFECEEDFTCIPNSKRCNGVNDCPNGSDEHYTTCVDLRLVHNHKIVTEKPKTAVAAQTVPPDRNIGFHYPEGCLQIGKKSIECIGLNGTAVAWDDFHPETRGLTFNASEQGTDFAWDHPNATSVLRKQSILRIINHTAEFFVDFPWAAFQDNSKIGYFYVMHTEIGEVPFRSFSNCSNLRLVWMTDSKITSFGSASFQFLPRLWSLILTGNELTLEDYIFPVMPRLELLNLGHNKIKNISSKTFMNLETLLELDLRNNLISYLDPLAFAGNVLLLELKLTENLLRKLNGSVFEHLPNLTTLELGGNPLVLDNPDEFCKAPSIEKLNLTGIPIIYYGNNLLQCLPNLHYLHLDRFQYCRLAPHIPVCSPASDGLSTKEDLLGKESLRRVTWVVSVLSIVGNAIVLQGRIFRVRQRRTLDIFVINLAVADILTGFYLLIIAVKDMQFRGKYYGRAYDWTSSDTCQLLGFVAIISSEASLSILTIMSLERYSVISGPYSAQKLTRKLALISMTIIWIYAIALAVTPTFFWRGNNAFYGSSDLCLPLHLIYPYDVGWEYAAFVFIGVNSFCLVVISFAYGRLWWVIREGRLSMSGSVREMEMALTVRFFVMVLTDYLCWIPIIVLKLAVFCGYSLPEDVHAWLLVFVLPLNSMINPFLYTFSIGNVQLQCLKRYFARLTAGVTPVRLPRDSYDLGVAPADRKLLETPLCTNICRPTKLDTTSQPQDHQRDSTGSRSSVSVSSARTTESRVPEN